MGLQVDPETGLTRLVNNEKQDLPMEPEVRDDGQEMVNQVSAILSESNQVLVQQLNRVLESNRQETLRFLRKHTRYSIFGMVVEIVFTVTAISLLGLLWLGVT